MTLVYNDERCVNELNNQWHRYETIILDTDLFDIDLAKKILGLVPAKKVVITTGDDHASTREAELIGIKNDRVLLKPVKLSRLGSAILDN